MASTAASQGMPAAAAASQAHDTATTTTSTTAAAAATTTTTVRVHVTQFDRSERPNPSPQHVRSAVMATRHDTGLDSAGRPASSLLADLDNRLSISQPSMSTSSSSSSQASRSVSRTDAARLDDDFDGTAASSASDDDDDDDNDDVMPDPRIMREKDLMWPAKLKNMTGITDLLKITFLELRVNTHHQSLGNIGSYLPGLRELKLNGSSLRSLRDVGTRLTSLKVLGVADCGLTVLDGLIAMPNLEELYAAYNYVSDLNALMALELIRVVDLEENCVDDIGQIGCLALSLNMDTLTLAGNPLCTRPTPSDPDPMPGYDYAATVRRYIPGLKTLDDIPLGAARPSASLQRPRPGSARQRPATATGGGRAADALASDADARRRVRPLSARGATNVSKLTESMRELPGLDEGDDDVDDVDDAEHGKRPTSASGRQSSLSVVGEALVGNPVRALRRLHQQQQQQQQRSASSTSHHDDLVAGAAAAERPASPLAARKPSGGASRRDANDSSASARRTNLAEAAAAGGARDNAPTTSTGSPLVAARRTSSSGDAERGRRRDQRQRHSEARGQTPPTLAAIQPVMADTGRQRAEFLDDLRQWRDTFDAGDSLLRQAGQLSPVKDDNAPPPPPSSSSSSSSSGQQAAGARDSNPGRIVRRQLPKTPSGADGLPAGVAPRPPSGPRPDNVRRTTRPLTARASLQLGIGSGAVGTATTTTTTPSKKRHRRPQPDLQSSSEQPSPSSRQQQQPEDETFVRVSTEDRERQRVRLRGGNVPRPSTAAVKKSGYLP